MRDSLVQQCLDILKREDVKNEFKMLLKPLIDFLLYELSPYIYLTVTLVCLIFLMIVAILTILVMMYRNRHMASKMLAPSS